MEFQTCFWVFLLFLAPPAWVRGLFPHLFFYFLLLTGASQQGAGGAGHLAVHTLIKQLLGLPKEASQMLPRFPAYKLCNGRLRLITWTCSNAHTPQLLFLAHGDAIFPSWEGLNGEPSHSWAAPWPTAPLPGGEEEGKSKGHELQKPLSFGEKA